MGLEFVAEEGGMLYTPSTCRKFQRYQYGRAVSLGRGILTVRSDEKLPIVQRVVAGSRSLCGTRR
jgi:hypothetical protein